MLLEVKNLKIYFYHRGEEIKAVDGVDVQIEKQEILALVGESGCGKSVTALSLTKLLPHNARIADGEVLFEGDDVLKLDEKELQGVRGAKISYIFQEPATSLNPVFTIGEQLTEGIILHRGMKKFAALSFAEDLLQTVGIPAPKQRLNAYPHELSGGMKQRVMIAMAIASGPALLVADEPTTALDVTIQSQILLLLDELRKTKGLSVLLITHDLSIVGQVADKVAIMYLGRIVEASSVNEIINNPLHPYTIGLMGCVPKPNEAKKRLVSIQGNVPDAGCIPQGCSFNPRCKLADDSCRMKEPELAEVKLGHFVRCIKV